MSWAFRVYISGLVVCPLLIGFNDPWSHALAGGFCLLLLLVVLLTIRPGEARFGFELLRPYVALASLPAIWMVIQIAPVPTGLVAQLLPGSWEPHAPGQSAWTTLSINSTASLLALGTYLCALALAVSAALLAIDRARAERLLLLLAVLTTSVALVRPVHDLGGFFFLGEIASVGPRASVTSAAIVGVLLNAAVTVLVVERFETRRKRGQIALSAAVGGLIAAVLAGTVCLTILIVFSSNAAVFAALTGLGAQLLITAFRRIGLTPRAGYLLAAIGIAVPMAFLAGKVGRTSGDVTLRFDTQASGKILGAVQDAISAAPVFGFGAGTFETLMTADDQMNGARTLSATTPPTTMAGIALELGRPAALIILTAAFAAAVLLIRGALRRGRDSFFPALGASTVLALAAEAFSDASLFSATTIAIHTAILGLAFAQSASRSETA